MLGYLVGYQRERLEVAKGSRGVRQQRGFRPSRNTREALIAMWVWRMCREAMGKMITFPAAE
jgi:hypothetical protein